MQDIVAKEILGELLDILTDVPDDKKAKYTKLCTDVAKDAADLVLLDDNFSTLEKAIREGRRQFANIQRFVRYLLSSNAGEVVASRIDNLIHASANVEEAEREIKLWFRPTDIPPGMQAYPVAKSDAHYYFKGGSLLTTHEPGSSFLVAPGKVAWASDLDALRLLSRGQQASCSLEAVAAKYLINEQPEQ